MKFNELKEKAKTKINEAKKVVSEKTEPVVDWLDDHKGPIAIAAVAVVGGIVGAISHTKTYEKGYRNGVSVGLGENIIKEYNQRIVGNAIDKIDKAGDEGALFVNDETGREIYVKKVSEVERF